MVDEDIVIGYILGYNDAGGGGSSGGHFDDVVVAHKYRFGDTPYGIATIDYNLTTRNRLIYGVAQWSVYNDDGSYTTVYGPISSINIRYGYALLKADKVVGFYISSSAVSNDSISYDYADGAWTKSSGDIATFDDCIISATETVRNGMVTQIEYHQNGHCNGKAYKELIGRRVSTGPDIYAMAGMSGHGLTLDMPYSDYTEWCTAFAKYGINLI